MVTLAKARTNQPLYHKSTLSTESNYQHALCQFTHLQGDWEWVPLEQESVGHSIATMFLLIKTSDNWDYILNVTSKSPLDAT